MRSGPLDLRRAICWSFHSKRCGESLDRLQVWLSDRGSAFDYPLLDRGDGAAVDAGDLGEPVGADAEFFAALPDSLADLSGAGPRPSRLAGKSSCHGGESTLYFSGNQAPQRC